MPFPSPNKPRIIRKELQVDKTTTLAEGLAPIARKKKARPYVAMKNRPAPVRDVDKLGVIDAFITRATKLFKLPVEDLADGAKALIAWLNFKNGARAKIVGTNKKALVFIVNRIESINFALSEGDISKKEYNAQMIDAVVGLNTMLKKLKARRQSLKEEILKQPEQAAPVEVSVPATTTSTKSAVVVQGFEDLQREFKAILQQDAERAAAIAKQSAPVTTNLYSNEAAENDALAAKSLIVLSRFEHEKARILAACKPLSNSKSGKTFERFVGAIMVRVEGTIPKEMKMLRVPVHSIGGGFYIFENQVLIAFKNGFYGQKFKDLRPVRDDFYFVEPQIGAKEIRWFIPKPFLRYMHNFNFSVVAFPWTKKWEPPKEKVVENKSGFSLKDKRELIIRAVQQSPVYAPLDAKVIAKEAAVKQAEEALIGLRKNMDDLQTSLTALQERRDKEENALNRKRIDVKIIQARELLTKASNDYSALNENTKISRTALSQLRSRKTKIWQEETERLLDAAKHAVEIGADKTEESFVKFLNDTTKRMQNVE